MATHCLRIDFDGDKAAITHRCTVEVAGRAVSFSEQIDLENPVGMLQSLASIVDQNRREMERRATLAAVNHVAALNRTPQKGVERLQLGGSVGPIGDTRK